MSLSFFHFQQLHETADSQQQHNDSWFWESDATGKEDGSSTKMADDLTTIPLDSNEHEVNDKLRQQITERETKVKSLSAENSVLNEKIKLLNAENQELNKSIEELDLQHQIAIEKVLEVKKSVQEKLNAALEDAKSFENQQDEMVKKYHAALDAKDAEKIDLKEKFEQLKIDNDEMTKIAKSYEQQIEELSDANLKFENEILELKEANQNHNENAPEVIANNSECLAKINSLINANFKLSDEYIDEDHFMATFTKFISATSIKIRDMDFEISKLIDENKHIRDESTKHIQERDALRSELINYEIECTELMKNNNILRADIENLRTSGKLETIMENDDDEEIDGATFNVNKSIDDEYHSIKCKLEATEYEKDEFATQIHSLKLQLQENVTKCKSYQDEIENLENEKCNYLFELNELKSEEERNILQKELKNSKEREADLSRELKEVEKERDVLLQKYNDLEASFATQVDALSTSQNRTKEESNELLSAKESELAKALIELERLNVMKEQLNELENAKATMTQQLNESQVTLTQFQMEKESLLVRCDELQKLNDVNLENLQKSNEQVQELQKKLLESTNVEELTAKMMLLEETLNGLTKEKEGLIQLVTTKHNENVQYHNEILRLNQLLQDEARNTESSHNETLEGLNDQIKFLREKCDLLAQNLLQEQNNYRILQQEKNDAVEMNNTLNKDIERLRQHLLEVADAYTFEQVSLQKQVEDYKGKLMAVEADAKQSATAYTSASIRANQQAETLQAQYNLLAQKRDELLSKLSAAEDNDNKNQAALTNLQIALEIFQRGNQSV